MTYPILMASQMHPNMQVAMFCLGVGVFMIVHGRYMWKHGKPELMMGDRQSCFSAREWSYFPFP